MTHRLKKREKKNVHVSPHYILATLSFFKLNVMFMSFSVELRFFSQNKKWDFGNSIWFIVSLLQERKKKTVMLDYNIRSYNLVAILRDVAVDNDRSSAQNSRVIPVILSLWLA